MAVSRNARCGASTKDLHVAAVVDDRRPDTILRHTEGYRQMLPGCVLRELERIGIE